jgi:shikimate dehydrogenase
MRTLAADGGGGNVTAPYKGLAREALGQASDRVERTGACNTFFGRGGVLHGENTDVTGVRGALEALDAPATGWIILGTGGAARAAALAAIGSGVPVAARSRSVERRNAFLSWVVEQGGATADEGDCRVVVNATPLGHGDDDPMPADPRSLAGVQVALDLVYRRGETAWIRAMRAAGFRAADGRTMLVAQGAEALEQWFPGVAAPVEVMRSAVRRALG